MAAFNPLDGITVLDLSQFVPGPYGTCMMSDLGAEVIKVEHPHSGDALRSLSLEADEESDPLNQYFRMLNRNKRSIAIDLKKDDGQALFYRLVEEADVVVESFLPGVSERLGVDYETLTQFNTDLIYCSVTGFGQTGPYTDVPGHDLNFQAVGGVASLSRSADGKPNVPATTYADLSGGAYLCISALGALLQGKSQYIDVAMADIMATWTLPYVAQEFETGVDAKRHENRHQSHPSYEFYGTKDNKYLAIAAVEPKFWHGLCETLGIPERIEDHQHTDPATREAVEAELADVFETKTRAEWMDIFQDKSLPITPVLTLDELERSQYVRERELLESKEGYGEQFRFPTLFSDEVREFSSPPPAHGEHTETILQELDLSAEEIEKLRSDAIVSIK